MNPVFKILVRTLIVPMLENARDHLNEYQLQELSQLLCEFQDVFAILGILPQLNTLYKQND